MGCCLSRKSTETPLIKYEDMYAPLSTCEKHQQPCEELGRTSRYSFDGESIEI